MKQFFKNCKNRKTFLIFNLSDILSIPRGLWKTFKRSSILLLLGFMRLFTVIAFDLSKTTDHSYGTHWNFFFTLVVIQVSLHLNKIFCESLLITSPFCIDFSVSIKHNNKKVF